MKTVKIRVMKKGPVFDVSYDLEAFLLMKYEEFMPMVRDVFVEEVADGVYKLIKSRKPLNLDELWGIILRVLGDVLKELFNMAGIDRRKISALVVQDKEKNAIVIRTAENLYYKLAWFASRRGLGEDVSDILKEYYGLDVDKSFLKLWEKLPL
jgi:hypothetical protein